MDNIQLGLFIAGIVGFACNFLGLVIEWVTYPAGGGLKVFDGDCNGVDKCNASRVFAIFAIFLSVAFLVMSALEAFQKTPPPLTGPAPSILAGLSFGTLFCMMIPWGIVADFYGGAADGFGFILYIIGWILYVVVFVKYLLVDILKVVKLGGGGGGGNAAQSGAAAPAADAKA